MRKIALLATALCGLVATASFAMAQGPTKPGMRPHHRAPHHTPHHPAHNRASHHMNVHS